MKEQSKLVEARQTGKDETGGETNPSLFPQKMKQNTINVQEEAEEEVSARRRVGGDLANVVSMLITLLKSQITSAMAATCHQGVINFGEGEEVRMDSVNVADDACTPPEGICYYSRDWGNVTLTPDVTLSFGCWPVDEARPRLGQPECQQESSGILCLCSQDLCNHRIPQFELQRQGFEVHLMLGLSILVVTVCLLAIAVFIYCCFCRSRPADPEGGMMIPLLEVTEKGKKVGEKEKEGEDKAESGELPDAEESPMEQTQFFTEGKDGSAKKGGRPRKKDLDEKMDGVAKLRCTGPSGATNDSLINSDDDEETVKGKDSHKLSEEV